MQPTSSHVRFGSIRVGTGPRLEFATTGAPGGPVFLFLHGYSDSWRSFSTVLPLLPDSVRAYALTQRGHGNSDHPPCCYEVSDLAADAAAFLDAMRIEQATVVGHSMGSFVAQPMALEYPTRVERLVLVGSYPAASNEVVAALAEEVATLTDPVPTDFLRAFQLSTLHTPIPETLLDVFVAESARLPAQRWRDLLAGMRSQDHTSDLHRIQAPTLILWGDHDAIFSRAERSSCTTASPTQRSTSTRKPGMHCTGSALSASWRTCWRSPALPHGKHAEAPRGVI